VSANSAFPLLTERCLQLLVAMVGASEVGEGSAAAERLQPVSQPVAAAPAGAAAAAAAPEGGGRGAQSASPTPHGSLFQQLLSLGLLDVAARLLHAAAAALARHAQQQQPPELSPASGAGWESGDDDERTARAAAAAAGTGQGSRERFEPSVVLALLTLLIEVAGQPGGVEAIEHHQQSPPAAAALASAADSGEASSSSTGLCPLLLQLLTSCASDDSSSGGSCAEELRERLLMTITLLPTAAAALAAAPGLAVAVAETLADVDGENLDAQDACWYLLAAAAKRQLDRQEGPEEAGARQEEGEVVGVWGRVFGLLPRCPLPESSRRYADAVERLRVLLLAGGDDEG